MERVLQHPLVREVRCVGLTAACELSAEARKNNPRIVDEVVMEARRNGVITRSLMGHSLQISPPLVITEKELEFMIDGFRAALNRVSAAQLGQHSGVENEMTEVRKA
jgi:4-aminobutyrate--pyruvate transaminase